MRNSILRNLKVFLAGMCGAVVFFFMAVSGGHSSVALAVVFVSLGTLFGYFHPKTRWQVGIWLSLPYLILVTWVIIATVNYNAKWEGVFWRTEIFYSAIYIYLSPVIAAFLGVLIGATRSIYFVIALSAVLVSTVGCEMYIRDHSLISRSSNGSLEIRSEGSWLRVDINCKYSKQNDYRGFRYFDEGGCGDSRITVLSKNPGYSLPTNATWVIDGKESATKMWPINGRDGSSNINKFDEHAYDDVRSWQATIPITSISNANQVEFRWGDISIQLQREQLETLKNLKKEFQQQCSGL